MLSWNPKGASKWPLGVKDWANVCVWIGVSAPDREKVLTGKKKSKRNSFSFVPPSASMKSRIRRSSWLGHVPVLLTDLLDCYSEGTSAYVKGVWHCSSDSWSCQNKMRKEGARDRKKKREERERSHIVIQKLNRAPSSGWKIPHQSERMTEERGWGTGCERGRERFVNKYLHYIVLFSGWIN